MTDKPRAPDAPQTRKSAESLRSERQIDGFAAEQLALVYLQERGLKVLERNFRCRFGEIDLIMQDGKSLVFVEVRKRKNRQYGGAAASVTKSKQDRLQATAQVFLQSYKTLPPCRFDVLAIDGRTIQWLKNVIEG